MRQLSSPDQLEVLLLTFFNQVIKADFDHNQLQDMPIPPDALLKDQQCVFTLSELHKWIFDEDAINFADFKRFLYQSTLNQQLQAQGFEIGIEDNQGKIAHSRYILKRHSIA